MILDINKYLFEEMKQIVTDHADQHILFLSSYFVSTCFSCLCNSVLVLRFSLFVPNGISYLDQLDDSISNLRNVRQYIFNFIHNLLGNSVVPDQIWLSAVCRCPIKKTLGLNGLNCSLLVICIFDSLGSQNMA